MALVLASRSEYFWNSEQFHFILAINVLFRDLGLNVAALGKILIYLLAAYVACRETKLEVLIASREAPSKLPLVNARCYPESLGPSFSNMALTWHFPPRSR